MPQGEGKGFGAGGLRLPPGYFMQYVAAPGPGTAPKPEAAEWILRGPDGAAVAQYAPGAAMKGAVEGAATEHRHASR